ncbi:MAG: hypothetical protein RR600_02430 [Aurantimicrobium sp.]
MAVHSFETMGTMVSIRIADAELGEHSREDSAIAVLNEIEHECARLN